jgi:diguanylate cyclase (GGDEF)-like protein
VLDSKSNIRLEISGVGMDTTKADMTQGGSTGRMRSEPGTDGREGRAPADLLAENQRLRRQLDTLLEQAGRNHSIMMRHQAFDLAIVGATSFPELIGTIFRTLPVISGLESVTLALVDEDEDIRIVMEKLGVDFSQFPTLIFARSEAELGMGRGLDGAAQQRPLLETFEAQRHALYFPVPPGASALAPAPVLRSVALVPLLRNKRLIGSLNLGSADPQRFTPQLGTDFIEHMASIIAICLENVISNEMLKYIGLTDSLTGVYNRRYIERRLLEEIARARRQNLRLACMYIDIDHFKNVNDTAGHQAGDEVLREAAARIKQELRLSDAVGRFGGEEFVALLLDTDPASACQVAERIRASVAGRPFRLPDGDEINISVSIGVAGVDGLNRREPEGPDEALALGLLANADTALYQAKHAGRNRVIIYVPPR